MRSTGGGSSSGSSGSGSGSGSASNAVLLLLLTLLLASGLPLLTSCASAPPISDPIAALALAEEALQHGDAEVANRILEKFGDESFARPDLERFKLLRARALFGIGELWDAYERIKMFPDEHPFSTLGGRVEELEFKIGATLIQSTGGFLFFTSDTDDGQDVLEHFVGRYPHSHTFLADAYRLLGEKAFRERHWTLARDRFRELLKNEPESEWQTLARFRIAMSGFLALEGPEYDLQEMTLTHNELHAFLASAPENPQMVDEARRALFTTREWLGRKHILIADFYRTIGNRAGEVVHLRAAAKSYPETVAGKEAISRLPPLSEALPESLPDSLPDSLPNSRRAGAPLR